MIMQGFFTIVAGFTVVKAYLFLKLGESAAFFHKCIIFHKSGAGHIEGKECSITVSLCMSNLNCHNSLVEC